MISSNAQEWTTFKCSLLRKEERVWRKYTKPVNAIIQLSSLSIRDFHDGKLLADFVPGSVRTFEFIRRDKVVRINPAAITQNPITLVLQFADDSFNSFIHELKSKNFAPLQEISTAEDATGNFQLPDLSDPSIQDLILLLLFDPQYVKFVENLGYLLDKFKSVVDDYVDTPSQSASLDNEEGAFDEFEEL